jgi:imidazolonepropionase-like amidohydrolase
VTTTIFTNANVLDTRAGTILPDHSVLVTDGKITEVSQTPLKADGAKVIDIKGRYLMPGLCDGHVHVTAITPDFPMLKRLSPFYVAARSGDLLRDMLMRGFTTVRDAGGADYGLSRAVDEDKLIGPRVLFCGHALSQTGGHGDMRGVGDHDLDQCFCCAGLGLVCDGIPEVRRAARDEIRKGATHIKIMASGGVSSPTDRIDSTQFALDEIDAIVEEATAANLHVMAHAYTARAINRLLSRGVRTIEHGNLMDEQSCEAFLKYGAFLTPTLATYNALASEGVEAGMAPELQMKVYDVLDAGARALEMAQNAGVRMIYGSDLLGSMQRHQLNEFNLRKDVVPAAELIRAATCTAAEAFLRDGEFGVVEQGARADLLVVESNPLEDVTVLTEPEKNLTAIMKEGKFYKNLLP